MLALSWIVVLQGKELDSSIARRLGIIGFSLAIVIFDGCVGDLT